MAASNLLEHFNNSVTHPGNEHGSHFEIAKCHCRCWFCPDCCKMRGYDLRAKLIPILKTFKNLFMVTFTVDPTLFPDPKSAYLYMKQKRCIAVTVQDLKRWGHLNTPRYFCVVEWQKNTQQAHFHVLFDTKYIPWEDMLKSWSKHRPKDAGPLQGDRPAFGTVLFSAPKFADAVHAGSYATKYLIKAPSEGFPDWILDMGDTIRIHRYSASKGFWGTSAKATASTSTERKNTFKTYRERIAACGDSVHVFEVKEGFNMETGEISTEHVWLGQLDICATVIDMIKDPGNPERRRRSLVAKSLRDVRQIIKEVTGKTPEWKQRRSLRFDKHHRCMMPPSSLPKQYPEDYLLHEGLLEDD